MFLRSGRPRRPRKAFKNVGCDTLLIFEGLAGPPGPVIPQKRTPDNSARLPSGTQEEHIGEADSHELQHIAPPAFSTTANNHDRPREPADPPPQYLLEAMQVRPKLGRGASKALGNPPPTKIMKY